MACHSDVESESVLTSRPDHHKLLYLQNNLVHLAVKTLVSLCL